MLVDRVLDRVAGSSCRIALDRVAGSPRKIRCWLIVRVDHVAAHRAGVDRVLDHVAGPPRWGRSCVGSRSRLPRRVGHALDRVADPAAPDQMLVAQPAQRADQPCAVSARWIAQQRPTALG
jgi:hypothetical protein